MSGRPVSGRRPAGLASAILALLTASPLLAQDSPESRHGPQRLGGVSDRISLRGGVLFASHSTTARLDSETLGLGTEIDVERVLGLDADTRNGRLDGYLRLGRRHQVRLGYVSLGRTASVSLSEQVQWGDEVFDVDLRVASTFDVLLLPVSYRFSLVKSDRIDLGLSAGVFAMFADASIGAPELAVKEAESANFPLPVFGADVDVGIVPRLFLLGGFEYFTITVSGVHGSWSEFRTALEYFPHPHLGFGAGYRSVDIGVDGTGHFDEGVFETDIFFDYRFRGPQVYVVIGL